MSDLSDWLRSDKDWPDGTEAGMRAAADEIDRLQAERAGDQQRLFHYEVKLAQLTEVAAFLDGMANRLNNHFDGVQIGNYAADCRAMAERLRKQ